MTRGVDQIFHFDGRLYVPCNTARLAAGPFLGSSLNSVEQHVELPPEFRLYRHLNIQLDRAGLAAAWVHGDSMMGRDTFHGDLAIFQRSEFDYVEHNNIMVIEKIGEEEGFGAWALKRLVVKQPRSFHQSEHGDEIDWNNPEIVLYSYNSRVPPSRLGSSGEYRVHGILRRSMRPYEVKLVDSDVIRRLAMGAE